jgi:GH43 family beta-xylosidase
MKMKDIRYIVFAAIAGIAMVRNDVHAQTFSNPISEMADPHITYYNNYYYLTGTTGNNITLRKATTLNALKYTPGIVVFTPPSGGPCCNFWAPELHRINNTWYIYYTAGTTSDLSGQRTWVIENTADDPTTGTWTNRGQIYHPTENFWAIDGSILSQNNKNYFLWSGYSNGSNTVQRIYIAEMSNPWTLTGPRVLLSSPEYSWERNGEVNEGPIILKKNGKVFLVYSASGCWTPDYTLGMLTMNEGSDPLSIASWTKSQQPVFVSNSGANVYGPGHNGFFTSPDGTELWNVYHATTVAAGACDFTRTTRAQKVEWEADGSPDFGIPVAAGDTLVAPAGEIALPVSTTLRNGVYKITARNSNKALSLKGCSPALGADVIQNSWQGTACQRWNIQFTGDGYFVLTAVRGGLALDVAGCSHDNYANVQTWAPNGAPCQQWKIEDAGNGYYRLLARNSNKALTVQLNSGDEGADVIQQDWTSAEGQQWRIEIAEEVITGNETGIENKFRVYPNPAKENITIASTTSIKVNRITLTDIYARPVRDVKAVQQNDQWILNTHNVASGLYLLRVQYDQKETIVKIIIEK